MNKHGITLHEGLAPASTSTVDLVKEDEPAATNSEQQILLALTKLGQATRAELIDATSLPRSTVSAIVRRLVATETLEECRHASSTGGRRPTVLRLAPREGSCFVGELGSHHARLGIACLDGTIIATEDIDIAIQDGQEVVVEKLAQSWLGLAQEHLTTPKIVGLAVPGPVNNEGRVTGAARMPGWNDKDLIGALSNRMGLKAVIGNDAHAASVGEWFVRGEQADSCLYVKAGTGVGGGWISGGVALRGCQGFAGDITHIRVQTDNPQPCTCGNFGCLETVASGAAILWQLRNRGIELSSTQEIVALANSSDPLATTLVREAGSRIGEVLSGLVNFLNPKAILIGGSLSQMPTLLAGIRSELYNRCLPTCTEELTIETSKAGADAPLIGMAVLARQLTPKQELEP